MNGMACIIHFPSFPVVKLCLMHAVHRCFFTMGIFATVIIREAFVIQALGRILISRNGLSGERPQRAHKCLTLDEQQQQSFPTAGDGTRAGSSHLTDPQYSAVFFSPQEELNIISMGKRVEKTAETIHSHTVFRRG